MRSATLEGLFGFNPLPPDIYYAGCGRRRGFMSLADVHAYEAGYHAYPHKVPAAPGTPAELGWNDHQAEGSGQ